MTRRFAAIAFVLASCHRDDVPSAIVVPPPAPSATVLAPPPRAAPPPEVVAGPEAPRVRPIDPDLVVDGGPLFLGANATDVWLMLVDRTMVVVNRASGCATESYPDEPAFARLREGKDPEAEVARADVLAALRDVVGLGRRFGARGHGFVSDFVWSPDGIHVFVQIGDRVLHSSNGGRSFARIDDPHPARVATSSDGAYVVYERCTDPRCSAREYVSLPLDGLRAPLRLTSGQTFLLRMGRGPQALFWRSGSDVCLDSFALAAPALESSICIPLPPKATGPWPGREFVSVSPSGNYGIVKWEEQRPSLTYVVSLVDMTNGKLLKTVTDLLGEVDDAGDMVLSSTNEGGGDHTYFVPKNGSQKLLGHHSLLAWNDGVAILGVYGKGTLGKRKCDLVKLVRTP